MTSDFLMTQQKKIGGYIEKKLVTFFSLFLFFSLGPIFFILIGTRVHALKTNMKKEGHFFLWSFFLFLENYPPSYKFFKKKANNLKKANNDIILNTCLKKI